MSTPTPSRKAKTWRVTSMPPRLCCTSNGSCCKFSTTNNDSAIATWKMTESSNASSSPAILLLLGNKSRAIRARGSPPNSSSELRAPTGCSDRRSRPHTYSKSAIPPRPWAARQGTKRVGILDRKDPFHTHPPQESRRRRYQIRSVTHPCERSPVGNVARRTWMRCLQASRQRPRLGLRQTRWHVEPGNRTRRRQRQQQQLRRRIQQQWLRRRQRRCSRLYPAEQDYDDDDAQSKDEDARDRGVLSPRQPVRRNLTSVERRTLSRFHKNNSRKLPRQKLCFIEY